MTVFRLPDEHIFPPPDLSDENGLLAVGGDLSVDRLILAYSMGIFPWYSEGDPILWWSPNPRLLLFPEELKVTRSLKQTLNKEMFHVTMDTAFEEVIQRCAAVHNRDDGGTWITNEMIDAYVCLHKKGYAHSVESWYKGKLVGGLYGLSIGSAFFGESMFTKKSNASKVAFVKLVEHLVKWDFTFVDCQITTPHLMSFGAREVPRSEFLKLTRSAIDSPSLRDKWLFID